MPLLATLFAAQASAQTGTEETVIPEAGKTYFIAAQCLVDGEWVERFLYLDATVSNTSMKDAPDAACRWECVATGESITLKGANGKYLLCGGYSSNMTATTVAEATVEKFAAMHFVTIFNGGRYVLARQDGSIFQKGDKTTVETAWLPDGTGTEKTNKTLYTPYFKFYDVENYTTDDVELPADAVAKPVNSTTGVWTAGNSANTWFSAWKTTESAPTLTLSTGSNNMNYVGEDLQLYTGNASCAYTLSVTRGWLIKGIEFTAVPNSSAEVALTLPNGSQLNVPSSGSIDVRYVAANAASTLSFTIAAAKKFIVARNMVVYLVKDTEFDGYPSSNVFIYDLSPEYSTVYRIPAIASIPSGDHAGRIVAVADYRHGSGGDIGQNRVDLHARYSDDFGQTWSEKVVIVEGKGDRALCEDTSVDHTDFSYGDPVIAVDRESGSLILLSCSGDVFYTSQTHDHHQHAMMYRSDDGGQTWTAPKDVNAQLLEQLDQSDEGLCKGFFVGSGAMMQSRFVKKGDYYRLYAAILARNAAGDGRNYAIYSDDLGESWNVLGGGNALAVPSGGNEAKIEELPDGNVVLSSRTNGRFYNIWTWDDDTYDTGSWGTHARTNNMTAADCNGELRIVAAKRVSDGKCVYLALQSVPMSSSRKNVGIYYKALTSKESFDTPATFAQNWEGNYQISTLGSAYSTLVMQNDHNIGFLFEEATYGYNFTIVYKNISIETITGGLYTWADDTAQDFDFSPFNNGQLATGVAAAKAAAAATTYNLSGVRVANPRQGLYIAEGKKAVVK